MPKYEVEVQRTTIEKLFMLIQADCEVDAKNIMLGIANEEEGLDQDWQLVMTSGQRITHCQQYDEGE